MPNRNVITSGAFAPDQPTLHDPKAPTIEVSEVEDPLTLDELTPHILHFEVIEQKQSSYGMHKLVVRPSERITATAVRELWAREHAVQKGYVVVLYGYFSEAQSSAAAETLKETAAE